MLNDDVRKESAKGRPNKLFEIMYTELLIEWDGMHRNCKSFFCVHRKKETKKFRADALLHLYCAVRCITVRIWASNVIIQCVNIEITRNIIYERFFVSLYFISINQSRQQMKRNCYVATSSTNYDPLIDASHTALNNAQCFCCVRQIIWRKDKPKHLSDYFGTELFSVLLHKPTS